jgi:gliding motility-associated-like protein
VYHVRIEDQNGCLGEDKVRVFVQETSIYIPNAFSPNGDNKNDFFTVYVGESVAKISYLKVFDRKGELVFERKDFFPDDEQKGWDGSFRGKRMDPNVFVYLVEVEFINGNKRLFKGDVTLLR